MFRSFASIVGCAGAGVGLLLGLASACGGGSVESNPRPDASSERLDGGAVIPPEGGAAIDSGPGVTASCDRYCTLVMTNCTLENAQYASRQECLAFCAYLPPVQPTRDVEEKRAASVACRQYWADSPARTDPSLYCLAAGPFGGNVCGDRCTAFCDVLQAACSGGQPGAVPAYASLPDCATACAAFSYRDPMADGGGESPSGPDAGDTLNCRLFHLRDATQRPQACASLRPDSGACEAP